jgi:hypothetical protein
MYVFVVTLNACAAAAFIKDAKSFSLFIQHLKQTDLSPQESGWKWWKHVVQLFRICTFDVHVLKYQRPIKLML